MKITIAGAGIAGLATALALDADGHDIEIFEAVQEIKPLGVGINLLPHAAAILNGLGVLDDLLKSGVATSELGYFNRYGQKIWSESRGLYAGQKAPQVSIARGELQRILLHHVQERLGESRIHSGHRLVNFSNKKDQAFAIFSTPSSNELTVHSDILICADGIHSAARAQLYPDEGAPLYSGRLLWRATTMAPPFLSGSSMIMAGHEDQKFVCYPIESCGEDGLQKINWIAELRRPLLRNPEDWNRKGDISDFYDEFVDWNFDWLDVPRLITGAEQIYEYPMVDRTPVNSWTEKRVTLLGDSAHPMYPIGSNGASQAILDAADLSEALREVADPEGALLAYENSRLPKTSSIVIANRGNGPEQCMQLAEERAPNGFAKLEDVFLPGELRAIADRYKLVTGLKRN